MTSPHFRSPVVPAGLFAVMMMLIREPEKVGQKTASQKQVAGIVGARAPSWRHLLIRDDPARAFSCFLLSGSGEQCAKVSRCQLVLDLPRPVGEHKAITK